MKVLTIWVVKQVSIIITNRFIHSLLFFLRNVLPSYRSTGAVHVTVFNGKLLWRHLLLKLPKVKLKHLEIGFELAWLFLITSILSNIFNIRLELYWSTTEWRLLRTLGWRGKDKVVDSSHEHAWWVLRGMNHIAFSLQPSCNFFVNRRNLLISWTLRGSL